MKRIRIDENQVENDWLVMAYHQPAFNGSGRI